MIPPHRGPDVGNQLADLGLEDVPPQYKKEGNDWFAIFNPRKQRTLDVDLVHNLPHQSVVCCVRFSLDGRFVATGCNRSAQIFDVETGGLVAHLQDGSTGDEGDLYIRSVCFSPDGKFLATGAEDKVIRVWDINNRSIKCSFTGHDQDIYSLDFSRNGQFIASGSGDRSVRLWDINSNQQILSMVIDDGVTTVAISPDNRLVAAGSLDKSVRVWDTNSGYLVERLEGDIGHKDSVYSVAFAPNGRDLVSGSLDKTIKMWELSAPPRMAPGGGPRGGKCIKTFEGHKVIIHHAPSLKRCGGPSSKVLPLTVVLRRTLFSASPSHQTATGSSQDPKTEAFNSGIHTRALRSSCFKATRIQVGRPFLEANDTHARAQKERLQTVTQCWKWAFCMPLGTQVILFWEQC